MSKAVNECVGTCEHCHLTLDPRRHARLSLRTSVWESEEAPSILPTILLLQLFVQKLLPFCWRVGVNQWLTAFFIVLLSQPQIQNEMLQEIVRSLLVPRNKIVQNCRLTLANGISVEKGTIEWAEQNEKMRPKLCQRPLCWFDPLFFTLLDFHPLLLQGYIQFLFYCLCFLNLDTGRYLSERQCELVNEIGAPAVFPVWCPNLALSCFRGVEIK